MNIENFHLVSALVYLTVKGYEDLLDPDEKGTYLYEDESKTRICEYCEELSLKSQKEIVRDQSKACFRKYKEQKGFRENSTEIPICKSDHGKGKPGCGNLTIHSLQESWKVIGLYGEFGQFDKSIVSVVYHVYVPVCKTGYKLIYATAYRCGENLQWNISSPVRCLNDSVSYGSVLGILSLVALIAVTLVVLYILHERGLSCGKRKQTEKPAFLFSVCVSSYPESVANSDEQRTEATVVGDIKSGIPESPHTGHDGIADSTTTSSLLQLPNSGGNVKGYDRPMPIVCSTEHLIVETVNEQVNALSVKGSPGWFGATTTSFQGSLEKPLKQPRDSVTGKSAHKKPSELGPDMTCTTSLEDLWDDAERNEVIQNLCHLLDPLGGAPRNKRWPGLARWYLGDKMPRSYICSIEYHKKGDPNDGPTLFLLHSFCSEGCYLGHIVWYFSQPENWYKEVVDLLVNCHACAFCEDVRKLGLQI